MPPSRSVSGASSLIASVSSPQSLSMSHIIRRTWLSNPLTPASSSNLAMPGSTSSERLSARQSRAFIVLYASRDSIRSRSQISFNPSRNASASIGLFSMNSMAS